MADVGRIGVILKLIDIVNEISVISDYRSTVRKPFFNLSRRLKMLNPLFEEIRDVKEALESAKELLRLGSKGRKIYLRLMLLLIVWNVICVCVMMMVSRVGAERFGLLF
ncbi:hypothetical protein HanPI659440_Chr17g0671931 [Helianthus annuus]|nr:hypothetical protein HanPI659440_Chr17g0671931 [Helianthus annuus]